jgi:hypothetical protein
MQPFFLNFAPKKWHFAPQVFGVEPIFWVVTMPNFKNTCGAKWRFFGSYREKFEVSVKTLS